MTIEVQQSFYPRLLPFARSLMAEYLTTGFPTRILNTGSRFDNSLRSGSVYRSIFEFHQKVCKYEWEEIQNRVRTDDWCEVKPVFTTVRLSHTSETVIFAASYSMPYTLSFSDQNCGATPGHRIENQSGS